MGRGAGLSQQQNNIARLHKGKQRLLNGKNLHSSKNLQKKKTHKPEDASKALQKKKKREKLLAKRGGRQELFVGASPSYLVYGQPLQKLLALAKSRGVSQRNDANAGAKTNTSPSQITQAKIIQKKAKRGAHRTHKRAITHAHTLTHGRGEGRRTGEMMRRRRVQ